MTARWPVRFMVYAAGESIGGVAALGAQISTQLGNLSRVATNPYLVAFSELGADSVPVVRCLLDPRSRFPPQAQPGANIGTPDELVAFVDWCEAACSAACNVVVLSGHGMAWEDGATQSVLDAARGVGAPLLPPGAIAHARSPFGAKPAKLSARAVLVDGADRDYLSNAQLGAACDRIATLLGTGALDLLVFDACLMSSWEILDELADSVSVVVASIDELSAAGVDYAAAAAQLSAAPTPRTGTDVAAAIVSAFRPAASFDTCVAIQLANPAWRTARDQFAVASSALLAWLRASPARVAAFQQALRVAGASIVAFYGGGLADVRALADALGALPGIPSAVTTALAACVAALRACVLGAALGKDYANALGLSIFAPGSATSFGRNRPDYVRLRFAQTTGWAACLDYAFGQT